MGDVCDESGYSTNGTDVGTMTDGDYIAGRIGAYSVNLDGSDDGFNISDSNSLDSGTDSFTVEAWIKHDTAGSQDVILAKHETSGADGGFKLLMESDGDLTFGIDDDNTFGPDDAATSTAATYDDDVWHHVAGVREGSSKISLYIDGKLIIEDDSLAATTTLTNNDVLYVGIDGDGSSNAWLGQLDDVRIYNYARTPSQIESDYNNTHGTLVKGAGDNANITDMWSSAGVNGTSLEFDGTDDYVIVGSAINSVKSVSFWVKPSTTTESFIDLDGGTHYISASSGTVSATGFTSPSVQMPCLATVLAYSPLRSSAPRQPRQPLWTLLVHMNILKAFEGDSRNGEGRSSRINGLQRMSWTFPAIS